MAFYEARVVRPGTMEAEEAGAMTLQGARERESTKVEASNNSLSDSDTSEESWIHFLHVSIVMPVLTGYLFFLRFFAN